MGCAHSGVASLVSIICQNIDIGFIPSVSGAFFLRKPPGMLGRNNSRVHTFKKFGALSDLTPGRFNNNPVSLIDVFFFGGPGMDLHCWVSVELTQPGDLSVFRMKKTGQSSAGNQDIGIFFEALRGTVRALRWFPMLREGVIAPFFKQGGIKLKLAGWRAESLYFIFLVDHLSANVIHLFEILP